MNEVDLYLESHVTISPVFDAERDRAGEIASRHGFKLAHLLMKKARNSVEQQSERDTFMTGHSKFCDDITERTKTLVLDLQQKGFKVWRYKIENTVLDSRNSGDIWGVLDETRPALPLIACEGCRL